MNDRHSGYPLVYQVHNLRSHGPSADLAIEFFARFARQAHSPSRRHRESLWESTTSRRLFKPHRHAGD